MKPSRKKILTLFGTRPEVIKLATVIQQLQARPRSFQTINVTSSQHTDLLYPFVKFFGIRVDHDLQVMAPNQTPSHVCARILTSLEPILLAEQPDLILIQGDTTTAMAGALAGFHRRIPVGHVEAGLRSGNAHSPFPEEMNRRLITRLATYHFAATPHNRTTLIAEGVVQRTVFVTGNPVVDALHTILDKPNPTPEVRALLEATAGMRRLIVTTHRRESFGALIAANLKTLRAFVERHEDVVLLFPVHPNPAVLRPATAMLSGHDRIRLIPPLNYPDFIVLLSHAWLIVSDSGGVQEEAPTLRKPLLILRENTERPEAVEAGVARVVGDDPKRFAHMLEDVYQHGSWLNGQRRRPNPFGRGDSGRRIVQIIAAQLQISEAE